MLIGRVTALLAAVLAFTLVTLTRVSAATGPAYPPKVGGKNTGVEGTKVGHAAATNSGLPHTGFEVGLLWTALALVVIGVVLLAVTRRRSHA